MKVGYKILIGIGIIIFIFLLSAVVLSQIKKETYVANLRLEATSGYPPRLILIRNEGIEKETALASIIPTFSIGKLSVSEPHTIMSGVISIDCGGDYQRTENFTLISYVKGDSMKQKFVFKGIPPDRVCIVNAKVTECETKQPICEENSVSLTLRIPK